MPQMAPMSWLILFIMFSFALILFNMMKFTTMFMKTEPQHISSKLQYKLNWKW